MIDPPIASAPDIGDPRTKTIAQQPEQTENDVGVCAGVGHDLGGLKFRLLFQHHGQQVQTVSQGPRNDDSVQPGELIRDEIIVGDASLEAEVFRVWPGVERPHRNHEAKSVGGCHFAATPLMDKRDFVVLRDQV